MRALLPTSPTRRAVWCGGLLALLLALGGCASMVDDAVTGAISTSASDVQARSGAERMGPHMLMTKSRPAAPGDRARAERLAETLRASITKYRDVEKAKADGYRPFPSDPPADMEEVHFVHPQLSRREAGEMDPERPGSLLYHQDENGELHLIGAMVTAPAEASLEELDARVPLSQTRWHLHTDLCVPKPIWDEDEWARTAEDGQPLFGPESPIATEAACEDVGGRFMPTIFGWMAHAYVFRDAADVWKQHHGGGHHGGGH